MEMSLDLFREQTFCRTKSRLCATAARQRSQFLQVPSAFAQCVLASATSEKAIRAGHSATTGVVLKSVSGHYRWKASCSLDTDAA